MKREDKGKKNKKIRESKYNRQYKYIKGEGIFQETVGRKETKEIDEVQIKNYGLEEEGKTRSNFNAAEEVRGVAPRNEIVTY